MFPLPLVAALAVATTPAPAPAAASSLRLETHLFGERRVAAVDGTTRTELVTPDHLGPGDRVVVQLRYRNTGGQSLSGVVIANPVPRNLAYRGPRTGPAPEVSVDGRRFGPLADLRVGERAATLSDVTHVRWRLPTSLTAGSGGEFTFQAIVR